MNEAIIIWLYLSLGDAIGIAVTVAIFATVCALGASLAYELGRFDSDPSCIPIWRKYFPFKTFILIAFLYAMYPTTDELKYIIGGAMVWNGVEAAKDIDGVEKLPANVVGAMNHFLEQIQEQPNE